MSPALWQAELERDAAYAKADEYRECERKATRPKQAAEWRKLAESAERRGRKYHEWVVADRQREPARRLTTQTAGA